MEKSNNPFAIAVMAHLKLLETKGDLLARKHFKYVTQAFQICIDPALAANAVFKEKDQCLVQVSRLDDKITRRTGRETYLGAESGGRKDGTNRRYGTHPHGEIQRKIS